MAATITAAALRYKGVPYVYGGGGPPGLGWDCSGFINWVLGHDLGLTLPGGIRGFNGASHGPVVASYATWLGARTVKGPPQPGDLCVFVGLGPNGHIGIALGPDTMISALNPSYGTAVTPIRGYGPAGAPLMFRRVTAVAGGPGASAGGPGIWQQLRDAVSSGELGVARALAAGSRVLRGALGGGVITALLLVGLYSVILITVAAAAGIALAVLAAAIVAWGSKQAAGG